MFIQLDKRNMHVQVICGILEEYKPNKNVVVIQDKVLKLKEKINEFSKQVIDPEIKEIDRLIGEENKKHIKENKKDEGKE